MIETIAVLTPPAVPVVDLAALKLHLRVEVSADDDLIAALGAAATALVEARVKGALVNRTLLWMLDAFPNRLATPLQLYATRWLESRVYPFSQAQQLIVPHAPLVAVKSIQYADAATGTLQTLDPATYQVAPGRPGRIAPSPGTTWPATADRPGAVTVQFVAGYGPDATTVPPNLVAAVKLLVGHWYRNREATTTATMTEVPLGVRNLINASAPGFYG